MARTDTGKNAPARYGALAGMGCHLFLNAMQEMEPWPAWVAIFLNANLFFEGGWESTGQYTISGLQHKGEPPPLGSQRVGGTQYK